jgi:FKBP-type peptidyl-prolyl cis-trans isomerase FkpA
MTMRSGLAILVLVAITALPACGSEDAPAPTAASESASPGAGAEGSAPAESSTTAGGAGFDYIEISAGSGPSPKQDDVVVVHYHGTFPDGKVFDSSRDRGAPARFPLSRVIPCWTKGLQMMHVGGKAKLVCRPETAYGAMGAPPTIPPNATLHFEVELLEIAP